MSSLSPLPSPSFAPPPDPSQVGTWIPVVAAAVTALAASLVSLVATIFGAFTQRRVARDQANAKLYQDAAAQLGDDQVHIRFAGAYALARLADEWPAQRQACLEVLCAYLRIVPTSPNGDPLIDTTVRSAIVRIIREHLQPGARPSWSDQRLNLKTAKLDSLYLQGSTFDRTVDLYGCTILGRGRLDGTVFNSGLSMSGATITGQFEIEPTFTTTIDLSNVAVKSGGNLVVHYTPPKGGHVTVNVDGIAVENGTVEIVIGGSRQQVELSAKNWTAQPSAKITLSSPAGAGSPPPGTQVSWTIGGAAMTAQPLKILMPLPGQRQPAAALGLGAAQLQFLRRL